MAILQNTTVSGSLVITGDLTARQFILSSSVTFYTESFASGSTRFGDSPDDFMRVTGSLIISSSLGGPFIVTGSTGNVGIGFTNPTSSLNINGNVSIGANLTPLMLPHGIDANGRTLIISGTGSANPNYGVLFLVNNTGNEIETLLGGVLASQAITGSKSGANAATKTAISFYSTGSGGSVGGLGGYMVFATRPNNAPSDVGTYERMRITNDGNIGIGTTTPRYPFVVYNAATGSTSYAAGIGGASYGIRFDNTGSFNYGGSCIHGVDGTFQSSYQSLAIDGSQVILGVAGTEIMRLASSGNVGIGTTNPTTYALSGKHMELNGGGTYGFFHNNTTTVKSFFATNESALTAALYTYSNHPLCFGTNNTERMRISSAGTISIASGGNVEIDNGYLSTSAGTGTAYCTKLYTAYNYPYVDTYLDTVAGASYEGRIIFRTNTGGGAFGNRMTISNSGAVAIQGALSKGSGTFRIDHPLESKKDTHQLVHSFVEGPRADLIYRGKVTLVNGTATINIDETVGMTEGTFVALNRDIQCFTTNESGWDLVKGKVEGNILTITSQNTESTDEISWMVIGERQDEHIKNTEWTDENGRPILEPLKP